MNKKGFTLVELLAVIAILAILVIIALPNVMSLFNEAKSNSFKTELKEIAKTAEQQWMSDSMFETELKTYARVKNSNCTNQLKLSGREEINYYIKLNKSGKIIEYKASDGTYQYSYSGNGLNIEDIDNVVQISNINSSDILSVTCAGGSGGSGGSGGGPTNVATCVNEGCTKTDIGTELIIAEESFYVVSSNSSETVLLSKYDINTTSNSQVRGSEATREIFSASGYWDGCKFNGSECTSSPSGLLSPYNNGGKSYCLSSSGTNCADVFDSNSYIYNAVTSYANKIATSIGISVEGRLLRLEEAYAMMNSESASAQSAVKDKNNSYYWLGSPITKSNIWLVSFTGRFDNYFFDAGRNIRPVIIVNTNAL